LLRTHAQGQTMEVRSQGLVSHAAELEEQSRRLLMEATKHRARARPYAWRAVEQRERAAQILEETREEASESEPMEWFETIHRSEESGVHRPHRVGRFPALDVDGKRSQGSI
jgi:hypothetical protein